MSDQRKSSNFLEWLVIAKKDWQRIGIMLNEGDAEAAGFFLQQSLEKYLKAFLLKYNWKLRKIHELDALLDDAEKNMPELGKFRDFCERVSGYYFTERYPPLAIIEITCEEIKEDMQEARKFVQSMFPDE